MSDNLSPKQRRRCMQRVRVAGTDIETAVGRRLHALGYRYRKNVSSLPGKPDLVFVRSRVVVFIDGDFWHGYRFSNWRDRMSVFWRLKIESNRRRDARNFRRLRRAGWNVIRVWQHEVKRDIDHVVVRIASRLGDG